jgi:hypothetical protein
MFISTITQQYLAHSKTIPCLGPCDNSMSWERLSRSFHFGISVGTHNVSAAGRSTSGNQACSYPLVPSCPSATVLLDPMPAPPEFSRP